MNTVTIYHQQCNGFGWHWMLDRGGLPMSSTEAFANAWEAERVARSVARCNDARYEGLLNDASKQQVYLENPRPEYANDDGPRMTAAQWQQIDRHGSYS